MSQLSYDPVLRIASYLSVAYLHKMKPVCRLWADVYDKRMRSELNISRVLDGFVPDHTAFRRFMSVRDVIIVGLRVINLVRPLDENVVCKVPLEILVQQEMGPDVCRQFIAYGYGVSWDSALGMPGVVQNFFSLPSSHLATWSGVLRVVRLVRWDKVVDVAFVRGASLGPVFLASNTIDMTFMNWERVYCLFPKETMQLRRGLVLGRRDRPEVSLLASLGFQMLFDREGPTIYPRGPFEKSIRWLGGPECFAPALHPAVQLTAPPSAFLWQANGFELDYDLACGPADAPGAYLLKPEVRCMALDHPSLAGWDFMVPQSFVGFFHEYIADRSDEHGMFWRYVPYLRSMLSRLPEIIELHEDYMSEIPQLEIV